MNKNLSNKRYITILTLVLISAIVCASFAGCADAAVSETGTIPSATPTVTPSPTPKAGVEAVFGKQITIAAVSNGSDGDSALFFEGAQAEAKSLGAALNTSDAGDGFDSAFSNAAQNADAAIACFVKEQPSYAALDAAAGKGLPVTVFEMKNGSIPSGFSHIYYAPESEPGLALDAALTYPPHDTPVRLILMFESKETESYKLYKKLYGEGKIFPKEIYIASEVKTKAGDWLKSKLKNYIAGMLDGVYAEDTGLAVNALDTLEALKRTDMEVFCPGITPGTIERMEKNPEVFAQSAGANTYLAGVLSVRAALKGLKGEGSVTLEMKPAVVNASELAANGVQAFASLNSEAAAVFNTSWMDELRQYYETTK